MIRTRYLATSLVIALSVAACTESGHRLPEVSEADRTKAARQIAAAPDLTPTARSMAESRSLSGQVLARLRTAAGPVCSAAAKKNCWYRLVFSPEETPDLTSKANQLVLTNGLAQYLANQDEFAAVMAHEIGHHIGFHYAEDAEDAGVGTVITGLMLGEVSRTTGYYRYGSAGLKRNVSNLAGLVGVAGGPEFDSGQEAEADYIAVYLMARAGYNPARASKVWRRLAKAAEGMEAPYLTLHPVGPERVASWRRSVGEVARSTDLLPNEPGPLQEAQLEAPRSFDARRHMAAAEKYRLANPEDARSLTSWGVALRNLDDQAGAIEKFRKALASDPSYAPAYNNWGNALYDLGRHEDALEMYQKAVALDPDYALGHRNLGLAQSALGDHEAAAISYRLALALEPERFAHLANWVEAAETRAAASN